LRSRFRLHGGGHRAFHGGAGLPQAARQLRARAQLGRAPGRDHTRSPLHRVLGFPERDPRRPIESSESREHVAPDASCRAPQFPRTAPGSPKRARTLSACHAPTWQTSQARSAFPRQVSVTMSLAEALDADIRTATGTSALPLWPSFPPAFTHGCRALDPLFAGCYPGEAWATCGLSNSAVERIHEHTCERSKPHPLDGQAHRWWVAPTLAGLHQLSLLRPGVARDGKPSARNPHSVDLSPPWIYPNLIHSDTSCRKPNAEARRIQRASGHLAVTRCPRKRGFDMPGPSAPKRQEAL
jgi:hypothetical protein